MALAIWSDNFLTGEKTVDAQHQELFRMVNELHQGIIGGKGKDLMAPTLDRLAQYTVDHFRAEEILMEKVQYPDAASHIREHRNLTDEVVALIECYKAGTLVLSITLSAFLANWLKHHIMQDDMALVRYVKRSTA